MKKEKTNKNTTIYKMEKPIRLTLEPPKFKVIDANHKTVTIREVADLNTFGPRPQFTIEYDRILHQTLYETMPIEKLQILKEIISEVLLKKINPVIVENKKFTKRESEIYNLLLTGMSNKNIAKQLYIQPVTVNTHVNVILQKMHVNSKYELLADYIAKLKNILGSND